MKILISAYACSPYKGSEPGVGWGFIKSLSHFHQLHILTEQSFKEDIERYQSETDTPLNAVFHYIPRVRAKILERIWPPSYYWTYSKWHLNAYHLARRLHDEFKFDLAHQLTMVGFREPGYLWQLEVPFVWGPIGGMGYFPWRFFPTIGIKGAIYYMAYNCTNFFQARFLSRPQKAAIKAGGGGG